MKHIARLLLSREFCARSAFSCALAALLAAPVAQASFLGDLATNANKVASSPYATGGDLILQLGASEYVHVFTNTSASATFTPSQALSARILVVGGGGGGGRYSYNACGGSGGGFVEDTLALAEGTDYAVAVGAGGKPGAISDGNAGKASSFGGTTLVAGGGAGGKINGANTEKLSGTPQANAGGATKGGGGGGAGGAGAAAYANLSYGLIFGWAGQGGAGIESDVAGWTVEYAAGGNGGSNGAYFQTPAQGGGGLGYYRDFYNGSTLVEGTSAQDGTGSGGGGMSNVSTSGKGGDGVVIVRYVAWSGTVPLVADAAVAVGGPTFALASARLASSGSDAAATLKAHVRKSGEGAWGADIEIAEVSGSAVDRAASRPIGGLDPATTYEWELWASNDSGDSAVSSGSFTTLAADALATGGAITTNGVRRIHTFTANGTFTLPAAATVDYLVVGGGGSGGYYACGGGGGGGQVIHRTSVTLAAGTYPVVVGAGGTSIDVANNAVWTTVNSAATAEAAARAMGGTSTFAGETAYGGAPGNAGSGYNSQILTGWFRGSSGGGGSSGLGDPSRGGKFGYWGAGHNGGSDGSSNKYGGGGGGAGGEGFDSTASGAGDGGAGIACAITGSTVFYGAGGGGAANGTSNYGFGGSGFGGDGGHKYDSAVDENEVAARCGKDGAANTGSGGGGAYGTQNSMTYRGGSGADGIVVVSYVDYSLVAANGAPILEGPSAFVVAADSASFAINVVDAGGGDGTAALVAHYGYAADALTMSATLSSAAIGPMVCTLPNLIPGTTYFLQITADNGDVNGSTQTEIVSFTTAPMFSEALSYTAAGGVLGFTVDGAATADSQRLELWVGADASSMTNLATYADASLLTAGSHTITPFTVDFLDETMAIMLRHVAVAEGHSFTNDSAVLTATLRDGATYTWKEDVADGDWCDAANWTATAGAFRGWPAAGSTAAFPACTATVRVDRAIVTGTMTFASKDCNLRFLGTSDGASLVSDFGNGGNTPFGKAKIAFDALDFTRPSTQGIKLESATELRIENGATFALSGVLWVSNPDASFTLANGSTMSVSQTANSKGVFTVDDSTYASGKFNLSYQDPAALHVLRGSNARIAVNGGFFAEKAPATIRIELSGEYSSGEALIKETGSSRMAESGGVLTFEAPETAASKNLGKCDILVADWSRSSINTALVEFGEVDREGSYFYYTQDSSPLPKTVRRKSAAEVAAASETAKYLWYHHAPPGATVLTVK